MQETVHTGKDKVQKICDVLRKKTLEPAIEEAEKIIEEAEKKKDQLLSDAQEKSEQMISDAEKEIEKRTSIFKSSLNQGARQVIEWLKQEIEERLFNKNLSEALVKTTSDPKLLAQIVETLVKTIEKEGIDTDLSVSIAAAVPVRAVNELLAKEILSKLKEKSVLIGPQKGGVTVKLKKENMTIDFSDNALTELLTRYIRKDFRQFFFANKQR